MSLHPNYQKARTLVLWYLEAMARVSDRNQYNKIHIAAQYIFSCSQSVEILVDAKKEDTQQPTLMCLKIGTAKNQ